MLKKRIPVLSIISCICCVFFLWRGVIAEEKTPIIPAVFLGDYQQAAIVLEYVWESESLNDQAYSSVITDIWYDGEAGLYIVAAPDPLRLYHWRIGEDAVVLVATQDNATTDIDQFVQQEKGSLQETDELFVMREGVLVNTATGKPLPTPPFEAIDRVILLPNDMIAVVSFREGISIVNMALTTSPPLHIDPWAGANKRLLRCFELANPDIPLQQVHSRNQLGGLIFGPVEPLHDMLRCLPGVVDVFSTPIEEAEAARRKGRLMDLSVSAPLADKVSQYYPRIQDALLRKGFLTGIPIDINPRFWSISFADWTRFGEAVIPQTMEEFITLLYGKPHEGGSLYMYPFDNNEVFSDWVFSQYIAQYAHESQPLSFDTQIFRSLLEAARIYDEQRFSIRQQYDVAHDIDVYCVSGLTWSFGMQGLLPPAFTPGEDSRIYTEMNVWCVDGNTPNASQALRFLSFQSRYTDPIYELLLIPYDHQFLMKLPAQAIPHSLIPVELDTVYSEDEVLLYGRVPFAFYAREMAPRLKFLFGGMYEDLDAADLGPRDDYSRVGHGSSRVMCEYIMGEINDIDAVIEEMNRLAQRQYDLWHEDGPNYPF